MISIFVPGIPRATQTGSVIRVNGRAFPIRRNTQWSTVFGIYAREQHHGEPLDGPVAVRMEFYLPAPQRSRLYPYVRPDVDGLAKGLLDQLNGVCFHDDGQVCDLTLCKRYARSGEGPGVKVTVERLGGEP